MAALMMDMEVELVATVLMDTEADMVEPVDMALAVVAMAVRVQSIQNLKLFHLNCVGFAAFFFLINIVHLCPF